MKHMSSENKTVLLVSSALAAGPAVNAALMLGISAGTRLHPFVGGPAPDAGGLLHCGLYMEPIAVLQADPALLRALMEREDRMETIERYDFSQLARCCRTNGEYLECMAATDPETIDYVAILLRGDAKTIRSLCGSLPLYGRR